jgi:hypothetical protein
MIGRTIAHYEVTSRIGAGGMGEVYRARDTKLGRDVALKALPDVFAQDPERLMRFEREARLLASLNHANIATIHGRLTSRRAIVGWIRIWMRSRSKNYAPTRARFRRKWPPSVRRVRSRCCRMRRICTSCSRDFSNAGAEV